MLEEYERYERHLLSRRSLFKAAAVATAAPWLLRSGRADAETLTGPRWMAYGADPTREMVISTSLPGPVGSARFEYGPTPDLGAVVPLDIKGVSRTRTRYGHATMSGLTPGTTYHYRIGADSTSGQVGTFRTAPSTSEPFSFTAFGDAGTVGLAPRQVVSAIARVQPTFHLVAGDLCYADSSGRGLPTDAIRVPVWDKWLGINEPVSKDIPWMNAVGNHEMEPGYGPQGYDGYLARFTVPTNGAPGCPATYHFRYGNTAFVQVDSNEVSYEIPANLGYSRGAQTRWLDGVLSQYRADPSIDFIVVTMHHCAYSTASSHGSEGGVRDNWVPLFDRYAVDLVLSGHNHRYERTHPMRGGAAVAAAPTAASVDSWLGTTYLVVGGGGAAVSSAALRDQTRVAQGGGADPVETAPWSSVTESSHCFVACSVTPGVAGSAPRLEISARNENGDEFDAVILSRSAPSTPDHSSSQTGLILGVGGAGLAAAAAGGGYYFYRQREQEL